MAVAEAEDAMQLERRCLAALTKAGLPASCVRLDAKHLKGGYICNTMVSLQLTSAAACISVQKNRC